jgi:hypothetical protein
MNKILIIYVFIFSATITLAQEKEIITVKAGTSLLDYVELSERYRYQEFTTGKAFMKTGIYSQRKFNYNYLNGELEFLSKSDTVGIGNKKEVEYVVIKQDTFYFDQGYILQIRNGMVKIGMKDRYDLKEIEKKDPYGVSSPGSASTSYSGLPTRIDYYKLRANQDLKYERERIYYLLGKEGEFLLFNKRNIIQLFPDKKNQIKSFLKSSKIKFDNSEDIYKLADYIESL